MTKEELNETLKSLASRRPVFHSEADFQHELALELVSQRYQVRLEVPKDITVNKETVKAEIDLLISREGIWTAIELKYVKKPSTITHDGETFELKGTWGTNLSRFDCLADSRRVEAIINAGHASVGYSVFLTNVPDAWKIDSGRLNNMAKTFSIHEGRVIKASVPLDWHPNQPSIGSVSAKRLSPHAPIVLHKERTLQWEDFSFFASSNQVFRYLLL